MQSNLGEHLRKFRRKSTLAQLTNELRRTSRVSTTSVDHGRLSDGNLLYAINFFPFQNGLRPNAPVVPAAIHQSALGQKKRLSGVWAQAFLAATGHEPPARSPGHFRHRRWILRLTALLQTFYDKSRFHYLLPIIVLVFYSFLGGAIFYYIESPAEQNVLLRKKELVDRQERVILEEINSIERRLHAFYVLFNNTETRNREIRSYKTYAINRLDKAVYWYVLQVYYLNDQETYKSVLLHPNHPERLWRSHFGTNFGGIEALRNYTDQLSERCWEIGAEWNNTRASRRRKLQNSIEEFNNFTGLQYVLTPTWTFWNSMFLAVTTYSTIGYGNITPKTNFGRLAAMVYAVIGIPLLLVILQKLGRFFLLCLEHLWSWVRWLGRFLGCLESPRRERERRASIATALTGLAGSSMTSDDEPLDDERPSLTRMPVTVAVGIAFSWMFLCAAIFLKFEPEWDYFKSFYFFFCSLTTIGYGDVTPTHSEDMFIIFGFIIVGLALVSMCINVIQLKLEELFEELLLTMMEEYAASTQAEAVLSAGGVVKPPKMGVVDLWKAWKKRRRRHQSAAAQTASGLQQTNIEDVEAGVGTSPSTTITALDQLLVPNSVPGAGLPPPLLPIPPSLEVHPPPSPSPTTAWRRPALLDTAIRRLLFPSLLFSERRRNYLIRRLARRLNQRSKAVQTDFRCTCFLQPPPAVSPLGRGGRGRSPRGGGGGRGGSSRFSGGPLGAFGSRKFANRSNQLQQQQPNHNPGGGGPGGRTVYYYYIDPSSSTSSGPPYLRMNNYSAAPSIPELVEPVETDVENDDLLLEEEDENEGEAETQNTGIRRPAQVSFAREIVGDEGDSEEIEFEGTIAETPSPSNNASSILNKRSPELALTSVSEPPPTERRPSIFLQQHYAEPVLKQTKRELNVGLHLPQNQRESVIADGKLAEPEASSLFDEMDDVDDDTPPMAKLLRNVTTAMAAAVGPPQTAKGRPGSLRMTKRVRGLARSSALEASSTSTSTISSSESDEEEEEEKDEGGGSVASRAAVTRPKGLWAAAAAGLGRAAHVALATSVHVRYEYDFGRLSPSLSFAGGCSSASPLSYLGWEPSGRPCHSRSVLVTPFTTGAAAATTTSGPLLRLVTLLSSESSPLASSSSSSPIAGGAGGGSESRSSLSTVSSVFAPSPFPSAHQSNTASGINRKVSTQQQKLSSEQKLPRSRSPTVASLISTEDERLPAVPAARDIQRFVKRRMSLIPPVLELAVAGEGSPKGGNNLNKQPKTLGIAPGASRQSLAEQLQQSPIELHFPPHTRFKRPSVAHHIVLGAGGRTSSGAGAAGGRGRRATAPTIVPGNLSSLIGRASQRLSKRRFAPPSTIAGSPPDTSEDEAAVAFSGGRESSAATRKDSSLLMRLGRRLTLFDVTSPNPAATTPQSLTSSTSKGRLFVPRQPSPVKGNTENSNNKKPIMKRYQAKMKQNPFSK